MTDARRPGELARVTLYADARARYIHSRDKRVRKWGEGRESDRRGVYRAKIVRIDGAGVESKLTGSLS